LAVESSAEAETSTSRSQDGNPNKPTAATIVDRMREQRVLAGVTGPGARVVKIRPPLAFSEAEIEPLAGALERALGGEGVRGPAPSRPRLCQFTRTVECDILRFGGHSSKEHCDVRWLSC